MRKKQSDSYAFHNRVGSHSTKGYGGGHVEVLPPEYKALEVLVTTIQERIDMLKVSREAALVELQAINNRLDKVHMSLDEYSRTRTKRDFLIHRFNGVNGQLTDAIKRLKVSKNESWSFLFTWVARYLLTHEAFMIVADEVERLKQL
jgi:hypothetical protein